MKNMLFFLLKKKMDTFRENVPLSEQINILIDAKNKGWDQDAAIPIEFHEIHRINLQNILNAGTSGLEGYTKFTAADLEKNETVIANSLQLMESGQLTGILYYYTYYLLLENDYGDITILNGIRYNKKANLNVYDKYIKYLLPDRYNRFYYNYYNIIINKIVLPFVGSPSPVATFNDLNVGFYNEIFPVGYSLLADNYYDGIFSDSYEFFDHDITHIANLMMPYDFNVMEKIYSEGLSKLHSEQDCSRFEYLFFMFMHEIIISIYYYNTKLNNTYQENINLLVDLLVEKIIQDTRKNHLDDFLQDDVNLSRLDESPSINSYLDLIDQMNDLGANINYYHLENNKRVNNLDQVTEFLKNMIIDLDRKTGAISHIIKLTNELRKK